MPEETAPLPLEPDSQECDGEAIIVCKMQQEISVFHNKRGEVSICFKSERGIEDIVSIPLDCINNLADALKSLVDSSY